MGRVTVGEELRALFRAQSAGEITALEFEKRKKELLDWSNYNVDQPVPERLRRH